LLIEGVNVDSTISRHPRYHPQVDGLYLHKVSGSDNFTVVPPADLDLYSNPGLADGRPFMAVLRNNTHSDWRLSYNGKETLLERGRTESYLVRLPDKPIFYDDTREGIETWRIVQKLGVDLVGVIVNNYCSYFGSGMQCKFCEIVPSYTRTKNFPTVRKPLDVIVRALAQVLKLDPSVQNVLINSGNFPDYDVTARIFIELIQALRQEVGRDVNIDAKNFIGVMMPPNDFGLMEKMKEAGYRGVAFNLEVWKPSLFEYICPGKAAYGRERMLKALEHAVSVFGTANVYSVIIYGLQSFDKNGISTQEKWDIEAARNLEAMEHLLSIGVAPFNTIYHCSGHNDLGPIPLDTTATLRYHLKYAETVIDSGVIPKDRRGVIFEVGSLANVVSNESYVSVRDEAVGPECMLP